MNEKHSKQSNSDAYAWFGSMGVCVHRKNIGARLKLTGVDWSVVSCLFADGSMILEESEREFCRV